MQGLAALVAVVAMGYGFAAAGVLGALTGLVGAVGIGTGLAVLAGEQGAGIARAFTRLRRIQRVGGLLLTLACGWAVYHGGWRYGWLWGLGAYVLSLTFIALAGALMAQLRALSSREGRPTAGRLPLPTRFD